MMPRARIRLAGAGARSLGEGVRKSRISSHTALLYRNRSKGQCSLDGGRWWAEKHPAASDHTVWSLTFRDEESQSATGLGRRLHWSADGKSLWTTVYTSYRPTSRLNVGLGRRVWTPAGGKEDGAGLGDSVAGRETPGALEVEPECERLAAGEFLNPPKPGCVLSFVPPQNPRSLRPG